MRPPGIWLPNGWMEIILPALRMTTPCGSMVLDLLCRLRNYVVVPEWHLEPLWLDRLEHHLEGEAAATFVLSSLRRNQPEGIRTLAHGDFSYQNLVCGAGRYCTG